MTRSRQKHNFRSWLNSRQREIEARKWGHTNTARLIVCAPTWGSVVGAASSHVLGSLSFRSFKNLFEKFIEVLLIETFSSIAAFCYKLQSFMIVFNTLFNKLCNYRSQAPMRQEDGGHVKQHDMSHSQEHKAQH